MTQQNTPNEWPVMKALTKDPETAAILALLKLEKKKWPAGSAAFIRAQFRKAADLAAVSLDEGYLCATAWSLRFGVAKAAIEAKQPPRKRCRKGVAR